MSKTNKLLVNTIRLLHKKEQEASENLTAFLCSGEVPTVNTPSAPEIRAWGEKRWGKEWIETENKIIKGNKEKK